MKKLLFILFALFFAGSIKSQSIKQTESEKKYEQLSAEVENLIKNEMYNYALEKLGVIFSLRAKNTDMEKEMYNAIYCYTRLDNQQKVIDIANGYERIPNKTQWYAKRILLHKGFALAVAERFNEAISALEKSIGYSEQDDFHNISQCYDLIGESYAILGNKHLAMRSYKKAIAYFCKLYNTSISQIEKVGINQPYLGYVFTKYRDVITPTADYKTFVYLSYLATKCGHKTIWDHTPDPSIIDGHPTDLFE